MDRCAFCQLLLPDGNVATVVRIYHLPPLLSFNWRTQCSMYSFFQQLAKRIWKPSWFFFSCVRSDPPLDEKCPLAYCEMDFFWSRLDELLLFTDEIFRRHSFTVRKIQRTILMSPSMSCNCPTEKIRRALMITFTWIKQYANLYSN